MADIVNVPPSNGHHEDSSAVGVIIGILLAVIVVGLFLMYFYGVPPFSREPAQEGDTNINVEVPFTPESESN